jgi:LmbE family N-acetylglucosaminyl deacetylase
MTGFFHRALRALYHGMLPASAKSTLRLHLYLDERDKPPIEIRHFGGGPVLVLAPHMDDEVIGCGGALCLHARSGCDVTALFLTDGARGDAGARAAAPGNGSALAAQRHAESRRAADVLGIGRLIFLDEPDGALAPNDALVDRLAEHLRELRPHLVYLPSVLDVHDDHWATNLAFRRALEGCADALEGAVLRQYEVWTPLLCNRVVDLASVLAQKTRALEVFESQRADLDLAQLALGLARYRSIHLDGRRGRGHAEAFHESSPAAYGLLLDRFLERT